MQYTKLHIISLIIALVSISTAFTQPSEQKEKNFSRLSDKEKIIKYREYANELYDKEKNLDKVIFYLNKSISLAEKYKDYYSCCETLYFLGQIYGYTNQDKNELKTYLKGLKYAELLNNNQFKFLYNSLIAHYKATHNKFQEAIKYYFLCLDIIKNSADKEQLSWLYNEIGLAYFNLYKYENALEYFFKALTLKDAMGDKKGTATTLLNIGTIYFEMNNQNKALEYLKQSLKIAEEADLRELQSRILNNIGNIYTVTEKYINAIKYLKKALKIKRELNDINGIYAALNNIGMVYEEMGNYNNAKIYYEKAIKFKDKINNPFSLTSSYRNLGNIYIKLGHLKAAKKYLDKALAIADSNNLISSKKDIYFSYAILYSNLGQHIKSDKYYRRHLKLTDSLNNAEYRNRMSQLEILYETEKRDRENRLLKLENEAKQNRLNQQRDFIIFLVLFTLLILILAYFIYKNYRERKKYAKLLEEKNRLLTESENNLRQINATKDKFFSIIAHDLRNPFAAITLVVDNLKFNIEAMNKNKLSNVVVSLEDTVNETKALLLNLLEWSRSQTNTIEYKPKNIDVSELIENTLPLLDSTAETKEIKIHRLLKKDSIVFADEHMLKTVIRNLISNAIKFTHRGGEISIVVTKKEDTIETSVIDTGIGIEKEKIEKLFKIDTKIKSLGTENEGGTGLGLLLCHEFIERHNGMIYVTSELNKGSKFTFVLPRVNR